MTLQGSGAPQLSFASVSGANAVVISGSGASFSGFAVTDTGTITSAMGSVPIDKGRLSGDLLTYEVSLQGAIVTHEARLDAAADTIAIKATGDWGTVEYVVKKVAAAK